MKKCSKCGKIKRLTSFNVKKEAKDGRQPYCKLCQSKYVERHYRRNKKKYLSRNYKRRRDNAEKLRKLKSVRCSDCKRKYPYYVMDFDHTRGRKSFTISRSSFHTSTLKLMKEVAKCDVVCANCHRERTYGKSVNR